MVANRLLILEHVSRGEITVDEAVTLLKVLSAIEAMDIETLAQAHSLDIDIYLN